MMRFTVILAAAFCLPLTAAAVARVSDKTILNWERQANAECRGSYEAESEQWCTVREALGAILDRRGWCYGREGEAGYQMEWHRCGADSIRRRQ